MAWRTRGAALLSLLLIACGGDDPKATTPCSPETEPGAKVAYDGVTPDGHRVVITRVGDGNTRVFYGTPEHMVEGRITNQQQSCAEDFNFVVDGAPYSALFAGPICRAQLRSKLTTGDMSAPLPTGSPAPPSQPLTVLVGLGMPDAPRPTASLTYLCF